MAEPIRDALYYPNIHITNHRWLKTALLTFPRVIRMTPHGYIPMDDPLVFRLSEAYGSRAQPMVGSYDLNSYAAYKAADILHQKIQNDLHNDDTFRRRFAVDPAWLDDAAGFENVLHQNKMTHVLRDILIENGLAEPVRGEYGWLAVHPTLATAFMSCVAAAAAKDEGLEIVTDKGAIHDILATYDAAAIYDAIVHGDDPGGRTARKNTKLAQLVIANNFDVESLGVDDLIAMSREEEALFEVDPGFGTRGLVGKAAVPLLHGADHDEENETED